jgi:hypothetical protein
VTLAVTCADTLCSSSANPRVLASATVIPDRLLLWYDKPPDFGMKCWSARCKSEDFARRPF